MVGGGGGGEEVGRVGGTFDAGGQDLFCAT